VEAVTAENSKIEIINPPAKPPQAKPLQAKAGGRWWDFLKKELDRAGLFLFASGEEGVFILGQPRVAGQRALYQLIRQRDAPANTVNVLSARHTNDTVKRASHYVVHGRGGKGTKKGAANAPVRASYIDEEMVEWGIERRRVVKDAHATNDRRAEYLCKRLAAEDRRRGWTLSYIVKGHTMPSLTNPQERVVWAVDTIVNVRDDELGVFGDFWIEGVVFRGGSAGTTTELTLIRPGDIVLGDPDLES